MAVQSNSNNNKLQISWHDSCWIPNLNAGNVMDYFSQKSNPFYDRTCNNEIIRMQRGDPAQLVNMTGVEYTLLLVQEPILYVIRKTHRYSPDKVVPLAYFYILGGVVYQCPDLHSLINSRLLSSLHLVHDAFEEVLSYAKYDTSKGYYWKFPGDDTDEVIGSVIKNKDQPNDTQRKRVDGLLVDLVKKYPPKVIQPKDGAKPIGISGANVKGKSNEISKDPLTTKRQGAVPSTANNDIKLPDTKKKKQI